MVGILDKLDVKQVLGYFAAGTTKRTSSIVDMANYDGVLFIVGLGTILDTGTLDAFVEQNTLNQTSGMARLATTTLFTVTAVEAAFTQSCILVNVYRPQERYLQCNITPAVANAVVLGITAIKYGSRVQPVPQVTGSVLKATTLTSPAEV
jgi:uncharacterized membrane protein